MHLLADGHRGPAWAEGEVRGATT